MPKKILMISSYLVVPIQVTSCCRRAAFPHWTLVHIIWAEAKTTPQVYYLLAMENPPTTSGATLLAGYVGLHSEVSTDLASTGLGSPDHSAQEKCSKVLSWWTHPPTLTVMPKDLAKSSRTKSSNFNHIHFEAPHVLATFPHDTPQSQFPQ